MNYQREIINVTREDNVITLLKLNHPKCVSDFIRRINDCIYRGYKDIHIKCKADTFYPNACVPITGIIQYFISRDISFSFDYCNNQNLYTCRFGNPYPLSDDDVAYANPLGKVFKFNSSLQVARLSQSYVDTLSKLCECESGVLNSISWCIYEVMDNVLTHSGGTEGYVMAQLHPKTNHIAICVYDSGVGIFNSLKNSKHHPRKEIDALSLAIQEGVGDGKGQGNGLYGLYESVRKNSGILSLTSGRSSIMLTESGSIKKYESVPILSLNALQTIVDFQINLNVEFDFRSIFSSISSEYEMFDPRIDDMLSEADEYLHYNVYEHSQGTATREAGGWLRNDVINTLRRENRVMILDFSKVHSVSSSFIDEFIGKLVIRLGFIMFNKLIRITNMNENVTFLCERSLYMRIAEEWEARKITPSVSDDPTRENK